MHCVLAALFIFIAGQAASYLPGVEPGVIPSLICEAEAVVPGQTVTVGLQLEHRDGLHSYWRNPGIIGVPTQLAWTLPEGFVAGDLQWPGPERCKTRIYTTYGYEKPTLLLVDIRIPEDFSAPSVTLQAKASWMTCGPKICCLLGDKTLSLTLAIDKAPKWHTEHRKRIQAVRAQLPGASESWTVQAARDGNEIVLSAKLPAGAMPGDTELYFFSYDNHYESAPVQAHSIDGQTLSVVLKRADYAPEALSRVTGVLYAAAGWPAASGRQFVELSAEIAN
jgi:DsbC/DsbD-like thiol-disulfide interchange protein